MRAVFVAAFCCGVALGAPDKDWKAEIRRLEREEKTFWKECKRRLRDALDVLYRFQRAGSDPDPAKANNPQRDYAGFDSLYADYALLQQAMGKADLALAASSHAKAGALLFKELLAVAKRIDKLEASLLKGRPVHDQAFDQTTSIERHGLARRRDGLVAALAKVPDRHGLLAASFATAASKDGRRSLVRRVALIDALGQAGGREAVQVLRAHAAADATSLRVAAGEALLRIGPDGRAVAAPLLDDAAPVVRRVVLQGVRAFAADDPGWIAPVLRRYGAATGVERAEGVRALAALTNQTFGDAPALWKEWYEDYRSEIEKGAFKKGEIEIREAKAALPADTLEFYGIATPSRAFVFAIDGSWSVDWPADVAVQLTDFKWNWHPTRRQWEDKHASHRKILAREFREMGAGFDPNTRFTMVSFHDGFRLDVLSKRLLKGSESAVRKGLAHIDDLLGDGWCAQYHALLEAARLCGLDPESDLDFPKAEADTIFLATTGDPRGGRFIAAGPLVEAFRRFNRFRRLVVHTVRWCDEGPAAETFLKGIAEASGGTYVWAKKAGG